MGRITLFIAVIIIVSGIVFHKTLALLYEGYQSNKLSQERAQYYLLNKNTNILDITEKLM